MNRSLHSADIAGASGATTSPPRTASIPFCAALPPSSQGPLGPLRNQVYPLAVPPLEETDTRDEREPPLPREEPSEASRRRALQELQRVTSQPQVEVITIEDDDDDSPPLVTLPTSGRSRDIRKSSSTPDSSDSKNKDVTVSLQQHANTPVLINPPLGSAPSEASDAPTGPAEGSWDTKAICGAHSKCLWVHGRQRPENIEKHITDLRTKVSVGKVSLRSSIFPSAAAAEAFIRAVSHLPRVTSLTISAPEMPADQFAAICEGLGSCRYLNHIDCNAIGSKPLRPAALQLLLQRLQLLPDLREVNLSGNEFATPMASGDDSCGTCMEPPVDGFRLLKGLLLRGVLCLLARECGLRQLRQFLLWVLNRCHCLRLRQLDLGASSKLLTTLVPGETFDEELLRRVSRISRATWRMGKVIGDYAPSFQAINLWLPHMTHTFWLYCLLDAMLASGTPTVEGIPLDANRNDAVPKGGGLKAAAESSSPIQASGGPARLPLVRVWGMPTDQNVSTPAHVAYFRYGWLVARLGDRCLVRWIPLGAFLASVEEDLLACQAAASGRPAQQQQTSSLERISVQTKTTAKEHNTCEGLQGTTAPTHALISATAAAAISKQFQQQRQQLLLPQQRAHAGGRSSARLAGIFGGVGAQGESLTDIFGAYDACVEAARVEPAVFAFAAWRQQQQQHSISFKPGQWVEVISSKKDDKGLFCSAIGVVQQVLRNAVGNTYAYKVEYLGLPPRSFTRLTLGGCPAPADIAAVLRSTVKVAVVPAEKARPLSFLSPNSSWTLETLRSRCGSSNCVNLPDAYGVDLKCPAYGGRVVYALPVACRSSSSGSCPTSSSSSSSSTSTSVSEGAVDSSSVGSLRWNISLTCQHLEFAAKQLLHPRQLFFRFGLEGPVSPGGAADQFVPLGVTDTPPAVSPLALSPPSRSCSPACLRTARTEPISNTGGVSPATEGDVPSPDKGRGRQAGTADLSLQSSPTPDDSPPFGGAASPKPQKRLLSFPVDSYGTLPIPSEANGAPYQRKKQHRQGLAGQRGMVHPAADVQYTPPTTRAFMESSVVVELSDDDSPGGHAGRQRQSEETRGHTSGDRAAPNGPQPGLAEAALGAGKEKEEEKNGRVEALSVDAAMWQTVRTCARCRMPLTLQSSSQVGGLQGGHAPTSADVGAAEGASSAEYNSSTAGVRRRFRAYVRRIRMENNSREERRLNRLLEDLQMPLPYLQDGRVTSVGKKSRRRNSRNSCNASDASSASGAPFENGSKHKQQSEITAEQKAFERCLRVLGGATAPASSCSRGSNSNGITEHPSQSAGMSASSRDTSDSRRSESEADQWSNLGDCYCTCNECTCCSQRLRFCRAEYHDPGGLGQPSHGPPPPIKMAEEPDFSREEWYVVSKALGILVRRGVLGLVACDSRGSEVRVRLLPLPLPRPSNGKSHGEPFGSTRPTVDYVEEEEELQELRRVLEQREDCTFGGLEKERLTGNYELRGPEKSEEGTAVGEGQGLLCERCVSDGWVSDICLPRLLERYRAGHTDTTCNMPSCTGASGRCGCRSSAKRRRPNGAKPLVFGWSKNSAFHGLAASAQACNMSQDDAELAYSEYASMQLENVQW